MKRVITGAAVVAGALALTVVAAVPASAQVVHSIGFGVGGFAPKSCPSGLENRLECRSSRGSDDVLVENLNSLSFDVKDFRGAQVFGEWNITFDDRVEVSFGTGFYRRTVPSVYTDFVDFDRSEIEQDLRLRIIPVSAVVRFLPVGRAGKLQPYLGGGVAALNWKYTETGEFIDFNDNNAVFEDHYDASGTVLAPLVLGGLRMPINGDVYALNAELRYQFGKGDLGTDNGFLSDRINLGGMNFTLGFQIRF
jgi:opacity protein-like surface antigen